MPQLEQTQGQAVIAAKTAAGGGLPVIQYWAQRPLSPQGPQIWKTLFHKSVCLSCAWGSGGQNGGFINQLEEPLQRCMKSLQTL